MPSEFKDKSFGEKPGAVQGWDNSSAIVQFDTDPKGAFVEVDGTVVCQQTPCSKELSLGKHEVAFKMIQYFSMTEQLNVTAEERPVLRVLKPNFGVLVLKTDPDEGFEVFLDGQPIGKTPLAATRLDSRPHKLVIKSERYYEKGIEFKPELGVTREILLKADPKMGALRITAQDSKGNDVKATVTIGGVIMGTTPYQRTLVIGSYDISVSASEGVWRQRHEVKFNDKKVLVASLRAVVAPLHAGWQDVTTAGCNKESCRFKDTVSGLEWSPTISNGSNWDKAISLCAKLTHDGLAGWRLPTKDELLGAYRHGIGEAVKVHWITAVHINDWFWSSSPVPSAPAIAWNVNLASGDTDDYYKDNKDHVACVR